MKRTSDPLLYELRRARATSNKRERTTKLSPPEPPPDVRTSPPEPPVQETEPVVFDPPPVVVEKNVSLKTTESVDLPVEPERMIETNDVSSGLDWMLRRK